MFKKEIKCAGHLYPMPVVIVGANNRGRANFMTAAYCGMLNMKPPMISVGLAPDHFTTQGIEENGTFSLSIPSSSMMKVTDYCGIVSGSKNNKVRTCKFNIFYGELNTAPLISECPVNIECSLYQAQSMGSHVLVIGKVVECYVNEYCLTEGKPDLEKIKPLIYAGNSYYDFGEVIGRAFKIGKQLKNKQE